MAHKVDWLPARREQQIEMAKKWYNVLHKKAQQWKIPNEVETELEGLTESAQEALTTALGSRSPVDNAKCRAEFKELTACMRDIKRRYFLSPPLTDADYISLDLVPPDTIPTPIQPPTAYVEADPTFPGIHAVELKKIRAVAGTPPDPRSDYGVRIYYGLTGEPTSEHPVRVSKPPKSGMELPQSVFTKKKKHLFELDGESGNTAYFCLRYENTKGEAGPFGPIFHAVIP